MLKSWMIVLLSVCLNAKEISGEALDDIYAEAILFVGVFIFMSVISIVISKRSAKKFENENPLEDRKKARREQELQKVIQDKIDIQNNISQKIIELSKMLEDELITKEEFDKLKKEIII